MHLHKNVDILTRKRNCALIFCLKFLNVLKIDTVNWASDFSLFTNPVFGEISTGTNEKKWQKCIHWCDAGVELKYKQIN